MLRTIRIVATVTVLLAGSRAAAQQVPNTAYLDQLPPLVDRELFFGDPKIAGAELSPDGRFIAFRQPYRGVMNIWVKGRDEPFEAARPLTADMRPPKEYFWSEDSRYVLLLQDRQGDENFHLYAVDPSAAPRGSARVPPARDLTPFARVQARVYAVPEATPGSILVGLNDRDPQLHDVYRLDLVNGRRQLVLQNSEGFSGWTADLAGTLRLGVKVGRDGGTQVLRVDRDTLTEIYGCGIEETCRPLRFHKDGRRFYLVTDKGADVDRSRLVLVDLETGEEELVDSDPERQVDFGAAWFSDVSDELVATLYTGDRVRIYPKNQRVERDLAILRERLPLGELSLSSGTEDEKLFLVNVVSDVDPGSTFLYNRETEEVSLLYRSQPGLPSEQLAQAKPIRYKARDGLQIPAYLTLPRGVEAKGLPLVVMPHGGPWSRDLWGYDPYVQFLANRGYAVLQPNFRGSSGYGKGFLNAGSEEWGTGAMQNDISDGVSHLVSQGIADRNRVGIFGMSYGGYSTLAGLAFTADLYAAGVSYGGPANLVTTLRSIPPYWVPVKRIFDVRVGDPDDPEDHERLIRQSPLYAADRIKAPLLVIQGTNDPRVKKAESDQIVVALRDLGRDVEYLVAPDEGRAFAGRLNRLAVAAAIERFFAHHLFGRYQKELPAEVSERLDQLAVDVTKVSLREIPVDPQAARLAPLPLARGSALKPATLRYRTRLQAMGQETVVEATRTFTPQMLDGRSVWQVVEVSELPVGTVTDSLVFGRGDLVPIRRRVDGMARIVLDYTAGSVSGNMESPDGSVAIETKLDAPVFAGGSGLEISLAGLPLADGYRTTLRSFEPETQKVRLFLLSVEGSSRVRSEAGSFESFRVELTPLDGNEAGKSTLHLMKAAPHHVVLREFRLPAAMGSGSGRKELISTGPETAN